jgi:hypothetical protein
MDEILSPHHVFCIMNIKEKNFLSSLVNTLCDNAVVVEIGTYLGGSASIMAYSNPRINIHSFDNYDQREFGLRHSSMMQLALDGNARTLYNVSNVLKLYPNIHLYEKNSPDNISWDAEIDLYLEDGNHWNPRLLSNLQFWSKKIKINGYAVLHDYRPWLPEGHNERAPDVESGIDFLLAHGFVKKEIVHGMICVQKVDNVDFW